MSIQRDAHLLFWAAENGNAEEIRRFIPLFSLQTANGQALRVAAANGHTECVELLIAVSDPTTYFAALHEAARKGHADCVQHLILVCDPKRKQSLPLRVAVANGHVKCVERLIPVSDPKSDDSLALRIAATNGHTQCVELLYPVSEPTVALKQLQQHYPDDYSTWGQLQEMVEAERLKVDLHKEIGETPCPKFQRKI